MQVLSNLAQRLHAPCQVAWDSALTHILFPRAALAPLLARDLITAMFGFWCNAARAAAHCQTLCQHAVRQL